MYQVIVQRAIKYPSVPTTTQFKRWVNGVLQTKIPKAELTIRIVDKDEMTTLNATYRKKNKPTNVLSFPFVLPDDIELDTPILGDIVICAEVIAEEAKEQNKPLEAHWAHMVIHGVLHLLGFDHVKAEDADIMEAEEVAILEKMGFNNPYQI